MFLFSRTRALCFVRARASLASRSDALRVADQAWDTSRRMDADARAFDAAATALRGAERANAERALLELRARRDALQIARGVLERPR